MPYPHRVSARGPSSCRPWQVSLLYWAHCLVSNGLHTATDTISWTQFGMRFVDIMQDWKLFHTSLSSQSVTQSWYISTQCSVLSSTTSVFSLCHSLLSWQTNISCILYMENTHDQHAETGGQHLGIVTHKINMESIPNWTSKYSNRPRCVNLENIHLWCFGITI